MREEEVQLLNWNGTYDLVLPYEIRPLLKGASMMLMRDHLILLRELIHRKKRRELLGETETELYIRYLLIICLD